jgi:hypothetical protein
MHYKWPCAVIDVDETLVTINRPKSELQDSLIEDEEDNIDPNFTLKMK